MKVFSRVLAATVLVGLVTPVVLPPAPAAAETSFGGFSAVAEAAVVRIGIYEPAFPIPAEPQLDVSLGYTRSNTSTGPNTRSLASYLWPGDTLGDGIGTLLGNDDLSYPVKVSSKFPASDSAPAENAIQITDGNGMATSADETKAAATVNGLQVGGNLASGTGSGMCALLKQTCPDLGPGVELPLPVATAASMDVARSHSTISLGDEVVSKARARATGLSLLAGLITIDGVDMNATASSDGKVGKTDGRLAITGLTVAGKKVDLGGSVDVDGKTTELPKVPLDLPQLGIKVEYLHSTKKIDGASGKLAATGLTITVDAAVLGKQLKLGALSEPLAPVLGEIPQLGPLLIGLLQFGTKIVINVGDVRVAATASPAYAGDPLEAVAPSDATAQDAAAASGGAGADAGVPGEVPPVGDVPVGEVPLAVSETTSPVASTFQFPGLSQTPSLLLLGGLLLAGLIGWLFKGIGAFFLGADNCLLGASVGVPNLREG